MMVDLKAMSTVELKVEPMVEKWVELKVVQ